MMPLRQYTNMLHGVTGDLDPVRAPPHLDHLWSDFWSWSRTAGRTTGRPRRHESVIGLPSGVEGGLVRRACDARGVELRGQLRRVVATTACRAQRPRQRRLEVGCDFNAMTSV